jgi:chemotaxis signal transduction protein
VTGLSQPVTRAWCSFKLGDQRYGVELERVQEVIRPQPVTRVPSAPPALAGLMNLRGRIVPVVDLRVLLGLGFADETSFLVIVRSEDGPVALLVDEIGDVERVHDDAPVPWLPGAGHPAAGHPAAPGHHHHPLAPDDAGSTLIAATIAQPDHLLVVLDLDRTLARAFERPGRPARPSPEGRS